MSLPEPIMMTPGTLRVSPMVLAASTRQLQHRSPDVEKAFGQVRRNVRTILGIPEANSLTMFPTTGRGGLEAVLTALLANRYNRVLFIANGRWSRYMVKIAKSTGRKTFKVMQGADDIPIDVGVVEEIVRVHKSNVLVFTSHETERGLLNPTASLFALCDRYGMHSVVDAMSSIVIDEAPVAKADVCCFNACKGLRSLRDIALVSTSPRVRLGKAGCYLNFRNELDNSDGLTPVNPFPVGPVLALAEATSELLEQGVEARRSEIIRNMKLVHAWADRTGLQRITKPEYTGWVTLPLRLPRNWSYQPLRKRLLEVGFDVYYSYEGSEGSTFEISTLGWLLEQEVKQFLSECSRIMELPQ